MAMSKTTMSEELTSCIQYCRIEVDGLDVCREAGLVLSYSLRAATKLQGKDGAGAAAPNNDPTWMARKGGR